MYPRAPGVRVWKNAMLWKYMSQHLHVFSKSVIFNEICFSMGMDIYGYD